MLDQLSQFGYIRKSLYRTHHFDPRGKRIHIANLCNVWPIVFQGTELMRESYFDDMTVAKAKEWDITDGSQRNDQDLITKP